MATTAEGATAIPWMVIKLLTDQSFAAHWARAAGAQAQRGGDLAMPAEQNKAVFRRVVGMWASGEVAGIDAVVDAEYVGHVAAGERDRAGLLARMAAFRSLFPDVVFTIEDQLADGEQVASRLTARGTHQPTGKRMTLIGLNISRFARGRLVEEWATWETLAG